MSRGVSVGQREILMAISGGKPVPLSAIVDRWIYDVRGIDLFEECRNLTTDERRQYNRTVKRALRSLQQRGLAVDLGMLRYKDVDDVGRRGRMMSHWMALPKGEALVADEAATIAANNAAIDARVKAARHQEMGPVITSGQRASRRHKMLREAQNDAIIEDMRLRIESAMS